MYFSKVHVFEFDSYGTNQLCQLLSSEMYTEAVVVWNPPKTVGPSHTALHVQTRSNNAMSVREMLTYNRTEAKVWVSVV